MEVNGLVQELPLRLALAGAARYDQTCQNPEVGVNPMSSEMPGKSSKAEPVLLSGGNPQIAKGYGDAPVQEYIAAMPGWKRDVGRRIDAIIVQTIPGVEKAVKWNTPFYGVEKGNWFLGFHCITKYIKVAFFRGTSLTPMPPIESKQKDVRYFHIFEEGGFDEIQFSDWVRQASQLPGEKL